MRERTRSLTLTIALLVSAAALLAPAARIRSERRRGDLSGHLPGAARRQDRRAFAARRRLHGDRARLGAAELPARVGPVPPVPRGLGRPPAAALALQRRGHRARHLHARSRQHARLQRRARIQSRRRRRRRPSPARHRLPGHVPRAPQRPHRQLPDPRRQLPDHVAVVRADQLRAGLAALRAVPPGLRRHAPPPVDPRQRDRLVHARGPQRGLPDQGAGGSAQPERRRRRHAPHRAVAAAARSACSTTTGSAG